MNGIPFITRYQDLTEYQKLFFKEAYSEHERQIIIKAMGKDKPTETSNDRTDMEKEIRKKKELNNGKLS